jgi:peptidoglycan/xylan/chitin deacetylase (PgdA/CDA1 family)
LGWCCIELRDRFASGSQLKATLLAHRTVTELVALGNAYRCPEPGLRVLMYHSIGQKAQDDRYGYYSVTAARFVRQLDFLCANDALAPVALDVAVKAGMRAGIALTFDDGYADNLHVAAPLLAERNIPFTIFAAASPIQEKCSGFLTPGELRELAQCPGVSIGAHGKRHIALAMCDDQSLANELSGSKAALEDMIGCEVTSMSYPHGSVDRRVREAVAQAGYRLAACSYPGINRAGRDSLLLKRTVIFGQDGMHFFKRKVGGFWDWPGTLRSDPAKSEA